MIPDIGPLLTTLAALVAVLALIWLAQRLARWRGLGRPAQGGALRVDTALALDARRRLVVVACEGRRVLLLVGGPADVVVGWLPPEGV